jgi:hypothetical protein
VYTVFSILEKVHCEVEDEDCRSDGFRIYSTTVVMGKNGEIIKKSKFG